MNILVCAHNYYGAKHGASGGEAYMHNLCKRLRQLGHEIKIMVHADDPYEYDGFQCMPMGYIQQIFVLNNDLFTWADIVFTQLIGCNFSYNKCRQHNKPMIFFAHNFGNHYFLTDKTKVVYNSNYMQSLRLFEHESTVLQPLIDYRDYIPSPTEKRRYIALINVNENKGINQFIELADMLPQYEFLGIKGNYGSQITPDKSNIRWRENGVIDWSEIKILLVPSETESWSQVATEAICNGIPVICSDLLGIRENLSCAGIYIDRNKVNLYKTEIESLMQHESYYAYISNLSLSRAIELDPLPRVQQFNEWLINQI